MYFSVPHLKRRKSSQLQNDKRLNSWFFRDQRGQSLAEYIIVAILVAIIIIVAIRYFGGSITGQFQNATEQVRGIKDGSMPDVAPSDAGEQKGERDGDGAGDNAEASAKSGLVDKSGENSAAEDDVYALRKEGVGGSDELESAESITVDWKTLGFFALMTLIVGGLVIFRSSEKKPKKAKKKKK